MSRWRDRDTREVMKEERRKEERSQASIPAACRMGGVQRQMFNPTQLSVLDGVTH